MPVRKSYRSSRPTHVFAALLILIFFCGCAPRVLRSNVTEGTPGTVVSLSMKYLVGWPRVEIENQMLTWPQLRLTAVDPKRSDVPGEELVWIEDKVLHFRIPEIPPGTYAVIVHDDKGPPHDRIYSILETTAYLAFPPVWPFVFRSNQTTFNLTVLPDRQ